MSYTEKDLNSVQPDVKSDELDTFNGFIREDMIETTLLGACVITDNAYRTLNADDALVIIQNSLHLPKLLA